MIQTAEVVAQTKQYELIEMTATFLLEPLECHTLVQYQTVMTARLTQALNVMSAKKAIFQAPLPLALHALAIDFLAMMELLAIYVKMDIC